MELICSYQRLMPLLRLSSNFVHDDVIKWKHFPRYWPFVRGIYRSPVNYPHKGQWRRGLMFSLICVWIHGWVYNREAGDLRRYRCHYDVIVMWADMQLPIAQAIKQFCKFQLPVSGFSAMSEIIFMGIKQRYVVQLVMFCPHCIS